MTITVRAGTVETVNQSGDSFAYDGCTLSGNVTCTALTLRNCAFASAITLTVSGALTWDSASKRAAALAGAKALPGSVVDLDPCDPCFGGGGAGALSSASGTTTPASTDEYTNVTLTGTAVLALGGGARPLRCLGVLDLSAAQAGAIVPATSSRNGGNSAADAAGSAGAGLGLTDAFAIGSQSGTAGAAGGTGVGAQASAPSSSAGAWGGGNTSTAGGSGKGGASGTPNAGGAATNGPGISHGRTMPGAGRALPPSQSNLSFSESQISAAAGRGGNAGGGDGTNKGGGGGGGGAAAPMCTIFARYVKLSSSTPAACITNPGGNGGNGGNAAAGTAGGGSGGGGGAGGPIFIWCEYVLGSNIPSGVCSAAGGTGGNGGNGISAGAGGEGGNGGDGGQIFIYVSSKNATLRVAGSAGSVGGAASGTTGGTGGAGGACTGTFP